jgi:REP-associated tyrosine transposase
MPVMVTQRYRKTAGSVYNLHFHVVWCPKYRKPVLVGEVAKRLKQLLREKAKELDIEIEALEIRPDHVHLFVSTPPLYAPAQIAFQFKGFTSHALRLEFRHLRTTLPTLWSRSYYIGSAGAVTADRVKKYIATQGTKPS